MRYFCAFACCFLLLSACCSLSPAQIRGGMHDPDLIDPPDKPFSYFAQPNDVLGVTGCPIACEVTPEGYLWTGFGELMFFTGNPPEPTKVRIRTLHRGYLPIVEYDLQREGVNYAWQMFSSDVGGKFQFPLNLVKVTVTNRCTEQRAAFFSTAYRFMAPVSKLMANLGDARFSPRLDLLPKDLVDPVRSFNPKFKYSWGDSALVRSGRIIYAFNGNPAPFARSLSLVESGYRMERYLTGEVEGDPDQPKGAANPHTPVGVSTWRLILQPGQSQSLVFKLPMIPLPEEKLADVLAADYDALLKQTISSWEKLLATPPLRFPEQKVQEYLLANTIANLIAVDFRGDDLIPNVNKFHYHDPYGGANTNNMVRGFEYMGLLHIARKSLLYNRKMQREDGALVMAKYPDWPYWELFGYNLWGWGRHYQLTRDRDFLEQVYPGVVKAMAWLERTTSADSKGLFPTAKIGDDAYLKDVRQTGQHMWALVGLNHAVGLAREMGKSDDQRRFEDQRQRFRAAFEKQLETQTRRSGGYIPPALERSLLGNDWDNLLTLYPEVLFDPFDPRVTATLKKSRDEYVEGLLSFIWPIAIDKKADQFVFNEARSIHYWQTPNNAQASLVRGTPEDQQWAIRELYALLLHTSAAHLPGEYGTMPWSTRGVSQIHNILPQGATSAKTIELMRNMLVREQGDDLYLFSALSPQWLKSGQAIEVVEEPTSFGRISFRLAAGEDGLVIDLPQQFRNAPAHTLIRVPWFFEAKETLIDGRAAGVRNDLIEVPAGARQLKIRGQVRPDVPALSFDTAVENYKKEYRGRYQNFLRTGEIKP